MFQRLWRQIKANRDVYLFLLPAVLALLVIVGYPLVNTVYYSFTDLTAQTMAMDSPASKVANQRAIKELGVVVPNLREIVRVQKRIVDLLEGSGTADLEDKELEIYQRTRRELDEAIAKARKQSVETEDGRYSFETFYSFTLEPILRGYPPGGAQRARLLAYERRVLYGDGQTQGLDQHLSAQATTLRDKETKQPTRFIGFRNYLEIMGLTRSEREERDEQARVALVAFFTELAPALRDAPAWRAAETIARLNRKIADFFRDNVDAEKALRTFLGQTPDALRLPADPADALGLCSKLAGLFRERAALLGALKDFAADAERAQGDVLTLLRRAKAAGERLDDRAWEQVRAAKAAIARLVEERRESSALFAELVQYRYGYRPEALAAFAAERDAAKQLEAETAVHARTVAILKDYPKSFGFWDILLQTIIWTIVNVGVTVAIGLYLAHWLNKRLRGNTLYRGLLMLPWTVPSLVAAFSWRLIYDYPDGFLNRVIEFFGGTAQNFMGDQWVLAACILVNVWVGVPFMMITMLGGLQTIPEEQYEAADIDGANAFQKFVNVTLPGLRPVAIVSILLGIIWTFNQFNVIYLVTLGSEMKSRNILVTYAYDAFNKYSNYAEAATYGVIILSLLLAFGSYYTRMLKKGGEL